MHVTLAVVVHDRTQAEPINSKAKANPAKKNIKPKLHPRGTQTSQNTLPGHPQALPYTNAHTRTLPHAPIAAKPAPTVATTAGRTHPGRNLTPATQQAQPGRSRA